MSSDQLQQVIEMIQSGPDLGSLPPPELRVAFDAMGEITLPDPSIAFEAVNANGVPCEIGVAPGSRTDATIFYLHGGGYVIGSLASHRGLLSRLGQAAAMRTLAVDYRLAPEHPFPAAVDDAATAYQWLIDSGTPPEKIVFAGDSAGGGLAVATMLRCKSAGLPLPRAAVLFSPFADMGTSGQSIIENRPRDVLVTEGVAPSMAETYLAGADPRSPEASPIYGDLTDLPPILIQVSSHEVLLDDSLRLLRAAILADVKVHLRVYQGLPHVWQLFTGMLDEGQAALDEAGAFFKEQL
ncbi:hypothetical protein EH30_04410 [Erythrobacter sp. JL475]|nr:hypothetical protein EH30_04410 [Erythrobacter sp. JL475]